MSRCKSGRKGRKSKTSTLALDPRTIAILELWEQSYGWSTEECLSRLVYQAHMAHQVQTRERVYSMPARRRLQPTWDATDRALGIVPDAVAWPGVAG